MQKVFNIYCDESCHLEHDRSRVMVLGAVWCPADESRSISEKMREIKMRHGLAPNFEIKWTKVSPAKSSFYLELLKYFFSNKNLHFRALVVPNKSELQHDKSGTTHHDWYYKMYFDMLKVLFEPSQRYRVYIDIVWTLLVCPQNTRIARCALRKFLRFRPPHHRTHPAGEITRGGAGSAWRMC